MNQRPETPRGLFITVEGSEGVGKTTNMEFIRDYLRQAGKQVVITREPGGTPLGEAIRELLLGHKHDGMADDSELLLMFAARAEHIARVIKPALTAGKWVLCDRFTDATYAYQGGGRGIDEQRINILEQWTQGELRPDLTILLDIPVAQGLQRAGTRSEPDRFEAQRMEFFDKVRGEYLRRAEREPGRFRLVDASLSLDEVQTRLAKLLHDFCKA